MLAEKNKEVPFVFPDMEAGVKFCFALEKDKVQDADADALFEDMVAVPLRPSLLLPGRRT